MKISDALLFSRQELKLREIDVIILLAFCLSTTKEQIIFSPSLILNQKQSDNFLALIRRRAAGEPVSHLINKREFYGNDFIVTPSVLDPRPDSEILITTILEFFPNKEFPLKILELGIGSGCLILSLLKLFINAHAIAIDIKRAVLEIAEENARLLAVDDRVEFIESNWCEKLNKKEKFDLILSNPPYIKSADIEFLAKEIKDYEPRIALDGGKDGLNCYRQIGEQIRPFLNDQALLIVEIGQNQEKMIEEIFNENGLKLITSRPDLSGITRCLVFGN